MISYTENDAFVEVDDKDIVDTFQKMKIRGGYPSNCIGSLLKKRVLSTAETVGNQSEIGFSDGFPTVSFTGGFPTIFRLFSDGFPSTN